MILRLGAANSQEAERLRDALTPAQQAGHCQVEIRTSVTAARILKVLGDPAYCKRLAVFHYAGHAEDYALLLEKRTPAAAIPVAAAFPVKEILTG